jgi:hypothetical protein
MNNVVSTKIYEINNSEDEISLSMSVGKGQISSTTIFFNHQILETGIENGFRNKLIGKNRLLNNSILAVDITVKDVNPTTNDTLIDIKLSGGATDQHQRYSETAQKDGDLVHYHITYFLKK